MTLEGFLRALVYPIGHNLSINDHAVQSANRKIAND